MPIADDDSAHERHPVAAVRGDDGALLSSQQAGQHRHPARCEAMDQVRRHSGQRSRENVGDDQVIGRTAPHAAAIAVARHGTHQPRNLVTPGIRGGVAHRHRIEVGGQHARGPCLGDGDRQHTRAAPHVERPAHAPPASKGVERHETAARRLVLARAERRPGVDQQIDGGAARGRKMAAANAITTDMDCRKARPRCRQPIGHRHRLDCGDGVHDAHRGGGHRETCLDRCAVGWSGDNHLDT
jgi:hypothetical protein